jgi:hypothetical protein
LKIGGIGTIVQRKQKHKQHEIGKFKNGERKYFNDPRKQSYRLSSKIVHNKSIKQKQ